MSLPLVLASGSPRRQEMLKQLGLSFQVKTSEIDETIPPYHSPEEVVCELAKRKAKHVAAQYPNACVIGADTVVVLDGEILGKPNNEEEAYMMLTRLAGRVHQVISGIALIEVKQGKVRELVQACTTEVWMKKLTPEQIRWYLSTHEPMDKAGAYGIQGYGACFIDKIHGCYFNVVGMSLSLLYEMMQQLGYSLFEDFV